MPNHYVQFSEVIPDLTAAEAAWIRRQFARDPEQDAPPICQLTGDDAWVFDWKICDDPEEDGRRYLWLYAEDHAIVDHVAAFVQAFLRQFRPQAYFQCSYAFSCSRPVPGQFGGGAVFVTATQIRWFSSNAWLTRQARRWRWWSWWGRCLAMFRYH